MEWVETTARSIDEAKELALEQLGVADHDAEFEVVEEPRLGLFGRTRGEARVRARVRPTRPRPKVERRDRRRGRPEPSSAESGDGETSEVRPTAAGSAGSSRASPSGEASAPARRRSSRGPTSGSRGSRGSGGAKAVSTGRADDNIAAPGDSTAPGQGSEMQDNDINSASSAEVGQPRERRRAVGPAAQEGDATVEEQAALVHGFLEGLLDAFDLDGDVLDERIDEDTIEVRVQGDDLGLLIGPKGQTLQAVQDLSRTFVQRRATGTHQGRVRIDIGAYRQRRREALERFSRDVAESVVGSGASKALEPMSPADRKVVHDTVNGIDGVVTVSEGVEPRRWVVILPATEAVLVQRSADVSGEPDAGTEVPAVDGE